MKVFDQITKKLQSSLAPVFLDVINESDGHNVAPGSETHFKVVIVSNRFEGLGAVKRHQAVYAQLQEQLKNGVHALALHTYTPEEWSKVHSSPDSPDCLGGG